MKAPGLRKTVPTITILALVLVLAAPVLSGPGVVHAADPVMTLSPASGTIGSTVIVSVHNLTPGAVAPAGALTFGGQPWTTHDLVVDSTGCLCGTVLTVPVAPAGPNAVVATVGGQVVVGVFTVTQPALTILPNTGYKGSTVRVTSSNWPLRTPGAVSLTFNGSLIQLVTPNSNGVFTLDITVPTTAVASNLIGAYDPLGNAAIPQIFTLIPASITPTPASGKPGTIIKIVGKGFQPLSPVEQVRVGGMLVPSTGLITDKLGAFTITDVTVPSIPGSGILISARVAGFTCTACFTINQPSVWLPLDGEPVFPIESALQSIRDKVIRVWGYYGGQWKMWDPEDPLGSSLEGLVGGRAYWVYVTEDCDLYFRSLKAGWNNMGW